MDTCIRFVSFHLTAQSESILLSTSEEEQPEDRSQPPKVGIRDFLELFGTRPFPETIAGWKTFYVRGKDGQNGVKTHQNLPFFFTLAVSFQI